MTSSSRRRCSAPRRARPAPRWRRARRWRRCWRPACATTRVLAKCRKEGVLRVGYAQTGPWFYKDAKTGELNGIYKDVVEQLAKEIQVKVDWKEVTFANVDGRAAARRLRSVRLVADLPGAARARGRFRRAAIIRRARCCCATRTTPASFKTRGRRQQVRRHVLGHVGRERGAAHSAAVPGEAEGHHDDRPGRRSAPSRCAPRRPTCGSAATAT